MQRNMQAHCAVFRTDELMQRGRRQARRDLRAGWPTSHVTDRSLIWNTDLIETLELDNLIAQAERHHRRRGQPQGKPRRPRPRGLSQARRRELDEAHCAWFDGWGGKGGAVRIDYRPVHEYTLTDEIEYIKPKARVY